MPILFTQFLPVRDGRAGWSPGGGVFFLKVAVGGFSAGTPLEASGRGKRSMWFSHRQIAFKKVAHRESGLTDPPRVTGGGFA